MNTTPTSRLPRPRPDDVRRRIELTAAVRDCDAIPKVDGAGSVREIDGQRVQVMHNGVLVEADGYFGAWMTELIGRLHGHHEPQEELVFHRIVERLAREEPQAPTIVELGAFWSYYSLWFVRALHGAQAIAVEPDPEHLALGRRNFALNGSSGTFIEAAVGYDDGSMWMPTESDGKLRKVRTATLGTLLREAGAERCELLLCDTQGAEAAVLDAARELIAAGKLRFAVISTHHHSISGDPLMHQRCLAMVRELGGHVIAEHAISESCSGDGLIAASFDERDRDLVVEVSHSRACDSLFGEPEYDLVPDWRRTAQRIASKARRRAVRTVTRV